MTDQAAQLDAFTTPGSLLRAARERAGMTEREAADQLKLMPDYVAIIERDDYKSLRSPPFARGYVKAYGRLLGLNEEYLVSIFDQFNADAPVQSTRRREVAGPLQLQRTGLGVVIGLVVLLLLVVTLWWWDENSGSQSLSATKKDTQVNPDETLRLGQEVMNEY